MEAKIPAMIGDRNQEVTEELFSDTLIVYSLPIPAISAHLIPTFPLRKREAARVAPTMACVADTGIL